MLELIMIKNKNKTKLNNQTEEEQMYRIKTRNWNGKKWVLNLLKVTKRFGVTNDCDKFYVELSSPLKAWVIWGYFMLLRRVSGGWTYIVKPNHQVGAGYKAIY